MLTGPLVAAKRAARMVKRDATVTGRAGGLASLRSGGNSMPGAVYDLVLINSGCQTSPYHLGSAGGNRCELERVRAWCCPPLSAIHALTGT
jgi:hypothetical protein